MQGMALNTRTRRRQRGYGELWPDNRVPSAAYTYRDGSDGVRVVTVALPVDAAGDHSAGTIVFDSQARLLRASTLDVFDTQRRYDRVRDHLAWLVDVCARFDTLKDTTYVVSVRGGIRLESSWEEAA